MCVCVCVSASASVACELAIILFTLTVIATRRQHQAQHLRSSCLSAQPVEFEPTIIDAVSDVPYSIFFIYLFINFIFSMTFISLGIGVSVHL